MKEDIEAQVVITQTFSQQAAKAIGDYAGQQQKDAAELRRQADSESNPQRQQSLRDQANDIDAKWGPDGSLRLAAHAVVGGLTGGVQGAAGAAAGTLTAPTVAQALAKADIAPELAQVLTAAASTAAGAAVGGATGAGMAFNEVVNNYLSHEENQARKKAARECAAGNANACQQRDAWDALDKQRDASLHAACYGNGASDECTKQYAQMQVAYDTYRGHYERGSQVAKDNAAGLGAYTAEAEKAGFKPLLNVPHYDKEAVARLSGVIKTVGNLALDLTPVVGDAKALSEAQTRFEYAIAAVGALGPLGDGAKVLLKEGKALLEAGETARAAEKVAAAQKAVAQGAQASNVSTGAKLTFDPAARTWITPGGIVYGEGSVHGNRIKHVLDHTVHNPTKVTHTLFNVDKKEVLGLIDEAWAIKGAPLPKDPGAYVVPMGRSIGVGGETNLKIIVRPGTNQLITAYPVK